MQPCEVEGIGSAELEFRFWALSAPGRMGQQVWNYSSALAKHDRGGGTSEKNMIYTTRCRGCGCLCR